VALKEDCKNRPSVPTVLANLTELCARAPEKASSLCHANPRKDEILSPMRTSRTILLAVALLVVAGSAVAQTPPPKVDSAKVRADSIKLAESRRPKTDISKLRFLTGCWSVKLDNDDHAEEIWSMPASNVLLSVTTYMKKEWATGYDFNRIEVTDSGVVLSILAKGKPEETYLMKTLVDEYVLFENLKKPFPQRIMYRLASDGALIPRSEGDGPSSEVRMHRMKCPGADIKLRP
jgi:hypothetical protein